MYERDRELIVQFGLRILRSNHVSGTSGNISLRVSQDMIAITPSGVPYDELSAKDIPIIDLEGHLVEGNLKTIGGTPASLLDIQNLSRYSCRHPYTLNLFNSSINTP